MDLNCKRCRAADTLAGQYVSGRGVLKLWGHAGPHLNSNPLILLPSAFQALGIHRQVGMGYARLQVGAEFQHNAVGIEEVERL